MAFSMEQAAGASRPQAETLQPQTFAPAAETQAPRAPASAEVDARAQQHAEDEFRFSRQSLDGFLGAAQENAALSDDQKNLLERLRNDPRAQQFDEVVYQDPASGQEHRFRDYFSGDPAAERALQEAQIAVQRYQQAFAKANEAQDRERRLLSLAKQYTEEQFNKPQREAWQAYNNKPGIKQGIERAQERVENFEAWQTPGAVEQFRAAWKSHDHAIGTHLDNIRASLEKPLPGSLAYAALEAKQRQAAQPQVEQPMIYPEQPLSQESGPLPLGEKLPPMKGQEGYDEMMSARINTFSPSPEAAYAGPQETTVMMPTVPSRNPVSRFFSAVAKRLFN